MSEQTEAQRLAQHLRSERNPYPQNYINQAADELLRQKIKRLEAANAELLEALDGELKIERGSSDRIIIEGLQEEAMHAAIKKHGGSA